MNQLFYFSAHSSISGDYARFLVSAIDIEIAKARVEEELEGRGREIVASMFICLTPDEGTFFEV